MSIDHVFNVKYGGSENHLGKKDSLQGSWERSLVRKQFRFTEVMVPRLFTS